MYNFKLLIQRYAQLIYSTNFLEKDLGIVSPSHFVHDFLRKMFLILYFIMLYSINIPNFIAWLSLLLEILVNMCIVVICCPVFDFINFEINLNFLINPFSYMTKMSEQKFKHLQKKLFRWNKHFSSFWRRFQLPEIVSDLRVHL